MPSTSENAAPAFLVEKRDNAGYRVVVYYARLNEQLQLDPFPLPTVDFALQYLGRTKYRSAIDLTDSFHQCLLDPRCTKYTSFCMPWAQYEFTRVPIGVSFGSQVLSRVLDHVFSAFKFQFVFSYVDDIIVYSNSWE